MKKYNVQKLVLVVLLVLLHAALVRAQYQKLDSLNGYGLKVYYSNGHRERAKQMALLSHNAMAFTNKLVNFMPAVTLLVLAPDDWTAYTNFPVYGMPHYTNDETLVVAAEDNALWKSFIPPMGQLPPALASQIQKVYSEDGKLSMQPFFDLLALHELGHAYHKQGGLNIQRKWMGELFCNMVLHTYIAEKEPALLPALTVFPDMVVASGTAGYTFTTLPQFENHYNEIGSQHPRNYGWYQSRLHVAAGEIYDASGKAVLQKLWVALQAKEQLDDQQLAEQLSARVHPSLADVLLKW